jgi:RNA polymerase sigma-70 factor (ECF subfamily)
MSVEEELDLVEQAKLDIHAFEKIYEYYFKKIYAYSLNRLANKELAEDITCEVFIRAVDGVKKFDTSKGIRFSSWLYRVAHNQIYDYFKKNKKEVQMDLHEHTAIDVDEGQEQYDNKIMSEHYQKKVAFIISKLKPKYQQVLSLKYYSELSNAEIAEVLDKKTTQVAVILHRALKSFEKKWLQNFKEK